MGNKNAAELSRLKKQEASLMKRIESYRKRGYGYAAEQRQADLDRCREAIRLLSEK